MINVRQEIRGLNDLNDALYQQTGVLSETGRMSLCYFCQYYWTAKYGGFMEPVEYDDGCAVNAVAWQRDMDRYDRVQKCRRFTAKDGWQEQVNDYARRMVSSTLHKRPTFTNPYKASAPAEVR